MDKDILNLKKELLNEASRSKEKTTSYSKFVKNKDKKGFLDLLALEMTLPTRSISYKEIAYEMSKSIDDFMFIYNSVEKDKSYSVKFSQGLTQHIADIVKNFTEEEIVKIINMIIDNKNSATSGESIIYYLINTSKATMKLFLEKFYDDERFKDTILVNPIVQQLIKENGIRQFLKTIDDHELGYFNEHLLNGYLERNRDNFIKVIKMVITMEKTASINTNMVIMNHKIVDKYKSKNTKEMKELLDMFLDALSENIIRKTVKGVKPAKSGTFDSTLYILRTILWYINKNKDQLKIYDELCKSDHKYYVFSFSEFIQAYMNRGDLTKGSIKKLVDNKKIGTNKKIEIMKNAGVDREEINKLKPNKKPSKKEKNFGRGMIK